MTDWKFFPLLSYHNPNKKPRMAYPLFQKNMNFLCLLFGDKNVSNDRRFLKYSFQEVVSFYYPGNESYQERLVHVYMILSFSRAPDTYLSSDERDDAIKKKVDYKALSYLARLP